MTTVRSVMKRDPNLTYPVITRVGIREVPGNVADNMERREMSDRDLIYELQDRCADMEEMLRQHLRNHK